MEGNSLTVSFRGMVSEVSRPENPGDMKPIILKCSFAFPRRLWGSLAALALFLPMSTSPLLGKYEYSNPSEIVNQ